MTRSGNHIRFDESEQRTLFEMRKHFPALAKPRLWNAFMGTARALYRACGDEGCSAGEIAFVGQALGAFTLLLMERWAAERQGAQSDSMQALAARVQALETTLTRIRKAITEGDLETLDLFARGLMAVPQEQP